MSFAFNVYMKRTAVLLFLFIHLNFVYGQESSWGWVTDFHKNQTKEVKKSNPEINTESKERLVTYEVINGDTIWIISLPDLVIMDEVYKEKYEKDLRYIKRMYPYARLIADISENYDSTLVSLEKRKERKRFIEHQKDLAMAQFESAVKSMSVREGKYLVKLIHRECGETAYNVISKYIGGTKTFLWQTASRLGGADLKIEYDPKGEDKVMEDIMKKVDKGEIKVKKLKIDEKAIEKKEAAEAKEKLKKKESKKSKK
jgi:hypothetical protein